MVHGRTTRPGQGRARAWSPGPGRDTVAPARAACGDAGAVLQALWRSSPAPMGGAAGGRGAADLLVAAAVAWAASSPARGQPYSAARETRRDETLMPWRARCHGCIVMRAAAAGALALRVLPAVHSAGGAAHSALQRGACLGGCSHGPRSGANNGSRPMQHAQPFQNRRWAPAPVPAGAAPRTSCTFGSSASSTRRAFRASPSIHRRPLRPMHHPSPRAARPSLPEAVPACRAGTSSRFNESAMARHLRRWPSA